MCPWLPLCPQYLVLCCEILKNPRNPVTDRATSAWEDGYTIIFSNPELFLCVIPYIHHHNICIFLICLQYVTSTFLFGHLHIHYQFYFHPPFFPQSVSNNFLPVCMSCKSLVLIIFLLWTSRILFL